MSATVRGGDVSVDARSAGLKRELGLTDLVFTQILFIVGLPWVGVAAKQGPAHVVFWLIALMLFYMPSAVVVTHLNRRMLLEGGLYQWAKLGFNEMTGFLVAWLISLSILPIVQVESRLLFALEISSLIVVLNAVGAAIFLIERSRDGADRHHL
jgi:amino acid transporter